LLFGGYWKNAVTKRKNYNKDCEHWQFYSTSPVAKAGKFDQPVNFLTDNNLLNLTYIVRVSDSSYLANYLQIKKLLAYLSKNKRHYFHC
jgi:hypothetical protein